MRSTTRILLIVGVLALSFALSTPQLAQARHRHPTPPPTTTPTPPPSTPTPPPSGGLVAPKLLSPANGAFIPANPTFTWTAVPGAVSYHIQINHQTYWTQQYNFIDSGSLTTSYFMQAHPEAYSPHLYWHVQAVGANGVAGPWSDVYQFTITTPFVP